MPKAEPRIDIKADALIEAYIDNIPLIDNTKSSRTLYEELRSKLSNRVSVSHFNQVRFMSRLRKTDL